MSAGRPGARELWLFADESKDPAYVMAAVHVEPTDAASVRKQLRGLLLGGQSRLHMAKESRRRQRLLASFLLDSGLPVFLYRCSSQVRPRDAIVRRLAMDAYRAVQLVDDDR